MNNGEKCSKFWWSRSTSCIDMVRKRKYPPAYYRYQSEHPAITIHVSKKIKSLLDNIKGSKSYSDVVHDILSDKLDLEDKIKELPKSESIIMYNR